MNDKQGELAAPFSSGWRTDDDDLPIGLIDLKLSTPPIDLVGDTTMSLLRTEQGTPAAVVKVARGKLEAAKLCAQRRVLAELAIHPRLDDEWRELVPRILAFDDRTDTTVSVESYGPGIDLAEVLARHPNRVEELTAAALSAIAPLHRRTATPAVDNVYLLGPLVVEPLVALTDMCGRLDPRLVPEVDRLGKVLRRALIGRRMPVSWTHGDYVPGNVRVAGLQGGAVTGIVDWGEARTGLPALIDEYLMILTASCQVERADLGTVVAERLWAGGRLSDRESHALRAARDQSGGDIGGRERIHEGTAMLLTWLHRVVDLWRKRTIRPNHHVWWATNVAPVLDAVAAWQGFDVSGAGRCIASGPPTTTSPPVEDAAQAHKNQTDG